MLGFTKMNGAGNFVLVDNRTGSHNFSSIEIAFLCDRQGNLQEKPV